jgi:hypothetical protein
VLSSIDGSEDFGRHYLEIRRQYVDCQQKDLCESETFSTTGANHHYLTSEIIT